MTSVIRFDFNGSSGEYRRTAQGFLRVNARLTKTGVFTYDNGREYRSNEAVFHADTLASLKGAPVTDLHPAEKGFPNFLTPANAKDHIIGITESVERDESYIKGSLIIFHEDTIKAIESGNRKEISLGYTCHLDPTPGSINGESFDAIQKDIIVNHVALGPQGWGRAGPDCAIRLDKNSLQQGITNMTETIHLDGVDIALTKESILTLLADKKREVNELKGRLDAMGLELAKAQEVNAALKDPAAIDAKVQSRTKLLELCRKLLGDDSNLEGKSDDELKIMVINKFYPDINLSDKEQSHIDGMFAAIVAAKAEREDSLTLTRKAINHHVNHNANQAYDKWLEHSAKMWTIPLAGSLR